MPKEDTLLLQQILKGVVVGCAVESLTVITPYGRSNPSKLKLLTLVLPTDSDMVTVFCAAVGSRGPVNNNRDMQKAKHLKA